MIAGKKKKEVILITEQLCQLYIVCEYLFTGPNSSISDQFNKNPVLDMYLFSCMNVVNVPSCCKMLGVASLVFSL